MIAVGNKGSYKWMPDGSLLLLLPLNCFRYDTSSWSGHGAPWSCWLHSSVVEAIGVDLNETKVSVIREGAIDAGRAQPVETAVTMEGGDVLLWLEGSPNHSQEDWFEDDNAGESEVIISAIVAGAITIGWLVMILWATNRYLS